MTRDELLNNMHQGRVRFEAALARFSHDQMEQTKLPNGWTIKDMLVHIWYWQKVPAELYDMLTRGVDPGIEYDSATIDAINAQVYEEHKSQPVAKVLAHERAAYDTLLNIAETASEEELFSNSRFDWLKGESFIGWITEDSYLHYETHIAELRDL